MNNQNPGSMDDRHVEIVDVMAETVLALLIHKDGKVRFNTNQSPQWSVATLRGIADQIEAQAVAE